MLISLILENKIRLLKEELYHPQASHQYKLCLVLCRYFSTTTHNSQGLLLFFLVFSGIAEESSSEVLEKLLNAVELLQVLSACFIEYAIPGADITACMRDRESGNQAAVDIHSALRPNMFHTVRFSHH